MSSNDRADGIAWFAIIALIIGIAIVHPVWWLGILSFIGGFILIVLVATIVTMPKQF